VGLELPLRATEADETRWHPAASSGKRRGRWERCRRVAFLLFDETPGFDGKMVDLLTCDDRMGTGKERRRGERRSARQQRYINHQRCQAASYYLRSTPLLSVLTYRIATPPSHT
jgi:hypothetical protein